jgi:hypothetical protein
MLDQAKQNGPIVSITKRANCVNYLPVPSSCRVAVAVALSSKAQLVRPWVL